MFAGAIDVGLRGGICGSLMFVNGTYLVYGILRQDRTLYVKMRAAPLLDAAAPLQLAL
jgi:hypothetical protein